MESQKKLVNLVLSLRKTIFTFFVSYAVQHLKSQVGITELSPLRGLWGSPLCCIKVINSKCCIQLCNNSIVFLSKERSVVEKLWTSSTFWCFSLMCKYEAGSVVPVSWVTELLGQEKTSRKAAPTASMGSLFQSFICLSCFLRNLSNIFSPHCNSSSLHLTLPRKIYYFPL